MITANGSSATTNMPRHEVVLMARNNTSSSHSPQHLSEKLHIWYTPLLPLPVLHTFILTFHGSLIPRFFNLQGRFDNDFDSYKIDLIFWLNRFPGKEKKNKDVPVITLLFLCVFSFQFFDYLIDICEILKIIALEDTTEPALSMSRLSEVTKWRTCKAVSTLETLYMIFWLKRKLSWPCEMFP